MHCTCSLTLSGCLLGITLFNAGQQHSKAGSAAECILQYHVKYRWYN